MKSYLVIILLSLFFSCDFGMPAEQKEYLNGIESVYPSLKEDLFKSELERNGYSNINYTIPNIGLYELGKSEYRIELDCDFSLNNKNEDSIIKICDSIIDELYSNVIEDSVIYDCRSFHVKLSFDESKSSNDNSIVVQNYSKKSLEKWNHFKVIKIGANKYKRVRF